uniref:TPM domain-containing protein n=1 Tax=Attheya septentrionalis TaxID=420275 RepID=A0A7S2UIY4_9STRA|mmetsp:Transcript_25136/g.45498  ORF Transcript_25136/g.45498 Transcript_25136/m.45498 type:complete len:246 (+) Transcript_25136:237-974(+)|eukprot:CAMPEP_0198284760 /NCGR_PEP_ID=MMETSP1449-20131203/4201_1 /TAXON_ID=420275 /ORGANISM="Attheya septentrionalis, Strain CCMP2084" /LENGTH=245 /DNA_ID=CAMNT_0043981973 /DNA_START=150 /DNA_END=887 /DNA_ORIENTATION=-
MRLETFVLLSLAAALPTVGAFTASPPKTVSVGQTRWMSKLDSNDEIEHRDAGTNRRNVLALASGVLATSWFVAPQPSMARLDAVDRPDLLPSVPGQNVIQIKKFLTSGQVKRIDDMLSKLERDTGFRVKVLCQAYPQTPGLAIRDYWSLGKEGQKDDKYIVLVVDEFGGKGNVLNFNVGEGVKFALPNVFWTRLQGKYGNNFFVRENGIDLAIVNAVEAIVSCLRTEEFCVNVPDEGASMKGMGF